MSRFFPFLITSPASSFPVLPSLALLSSANELLTFINHLSGRRTVTSEVKQSSKSVFRSFKSPSLIYSLCVTHCHSLALFSPQSRIRSLVHSLLISHAFSFAHLFIYSLSFMLVPVCVLTPLIQLLVILLTRSFFNTRQATHFHSLAYLFTPITHIFPHIHWLAHSLTHSLSHSHSLTNSYNLSL